MAATLTTNMTARLTWNFKEALDLSNVIDSSYVEYNVDMATGTGASTADKVWHDSRTLTTGTADNLDVNALTNSIYGNTVTSIFVKLRALIIVNTATTSGYDLTVGNGTNPWIGPFGSGAHTIAVPANGVLLLTNPVAGWTITNATGDVLKINNGSAGSITYKIALIGTSA